MSATAASRRGTGPRRHGSPRRSVLSEAEILTCALGIIKKSGVDGLTMRHLSDRLGVALGATYKHVPNKDALLRLVANELYSRIEHDDLENEAWDTRVRALIIRFQEVLSAYPGMASYVSHHAAEIAPVHLNHTMNQVLKGAGFSPRGVERAMSVLFFYTSGAMLSPASGPAVSAAFSDGLEVVMDGLRQELQRAKQGKSASARSRPAGPSGATGRARSRR